ncbi:MAG: acyl carrier protein [Verrucomicrobiae bacterium]|nr:acyl carrier protein [Verrucomicrobiae bacterium]
MSIEQEIRAYILENIPGAQNLSFQDEESLAGGGIVDSQGIIQIVSFVEQKYGVKFGDQEINEENCASVASFARFVRKRQTP